jgi:hypothetical protein
MRKGESEGLGRNIRAVAPDGRKKRWASERYASDCWPVSAPDVAVVARGFEIRPTSDRLRETLFNVLCAGDPEALAETTWLDFYAGTGAVGIEALSRGARMVHFVESSKQRRI